MKKNALSLGVGVAVGIVAGFLFANYYTRTGGMDSRSTASVLSPTGPSPENSQPGQTLTPEEIKSKLDIAENRPDDTKYQKQLGLALYAYGASKGDADVIRKSMVPLSRVLDADPKDREVLVAVGNAHFDIGYISKDDGSYVTARTFYARAIALNPGDAGVLVDIGLTYALLAKPDHRAAIAEYEKALTASPDHERTLQMMVESQLSSGDKGAAGKYLARLKERNPRNPLIADFEQRVGAQQ